MKFQEDVLKQIGERIAQLGLSQCPVCQSGTIAIGRQPVIVNVGGIPDSKLQDAKTNIRFYVALTCDLCGHVMLFDSERFQHGDERALEPE
jgi:hypothetical protein